MDQPQVELTCRAYAKMILHAAKYPHCAINGVLLVESPDKRTKQKGGIGDTPSDSSDKRSPATLRFVDCIPLFHQIQGLTPMIEVALAKVCMSVSPMHNIAVDITAPDVTFRGHSWERSS